MRTKLFYFVLFMLCLGGVIPASAAFKDIKIDLTNGNLLLPEEMPKENQPQLSFGVVIGDDGSATRVAADDANANIVLNGKFHSTQHGWGNFSATVAVEGPVKVSMGSCAWGGDVTVKNAAGDIVAKFNTNNGTCYDKNNMSIVSAYYKGTDATTLTISGGSYTPYIAVEKVDPSELVEEATVTFSLGDVTAEGDLLPEAKKVEIGKTVAIPANRTLYIAGKTLTGWTDGTTTYAIGEELTVSENVTLTPVFTDNTVSLADRTDAVTLNFDFQTKNGAPTMGYQNKVGIYVTQAVVNGQTIDVKLDFDTNNDGKIANASWTDWCQMNSGTKLSVPSCKGAVVSVEGYEILGVPSSTNADKSILMIDGQTDYATGKVVSYTIANTAETIDVVIGAEGSYYKYVKVVLPVVQVSGGKTYTNEPASVVWAFNDATAYEVNTKSPSDAFTVASVNIGEAILTGSGTGQAVDANGNKVNFIKIKPKNSATDMVEWSVTPSKGLTFTPTKVSGYIQRFGTDAENGVAVTARLADGTEEALGVFTAPRNNKTQAEDKYGSSTNYTNQFVIELTEAQQAKLSTQASFSLFATIGVGNTKEGGFSDIHIEGLLNGTVENVAKYTVSAKSAPEEAATIIVYPNVEEYDEGSEVKFTAVKNFGYKFVNWTDANGTVVSETEQFVYTVTESAEFTANFQKLNTYELSYNVDGGANIYMVQPVPVPTVVNGKNMYEEGTTVTLTASNNNILTFTNWSDGTSNSELVLNMTENKNITAVYSIIDFVAGWDFYKAGGNGRKADFAAQDNDADAFNLVNEETGATSGWLDKSQEGAGGYEGRPAAVNWREGASNGDVGHYYWQTMVNAAAFTNIKVSFEMMYNYNAYTTYLVAYSTDGTNWSEPVGSVTMEGAKKWTLCEISLPEDANNKESLYIRWYPDKSSKVDGTASKNDGNAIANVFILGTENAQPDPVAPALVSTVPADAAENSSATGKIILTFDKRVTVADGATAKLNDMTLVPTVFGKTVTFQYKNLDYASDYVFTLPENSVMNQSGVAYDKVITVKFKTMAKPEVAKAVYDFIVPDDGAFEAAIVAADSRADKSKRFRIFVKQGTHKIPQSTTATITCDNGKSYPSPITNINSSNISVIGEDIDATVVTNTITDDLYNGVSVYEQIGKSDVLQIQGSVSGLYFQDITIKSAIGDKLGRNIAIQDKGTKNIYKNVCLYGYQDTWVTNKDNGLYYFEGGKLRGRTDFLCGKGDVFYNAVDLIMCEKGGYIAVPSQSLKYGYVFKDCTIKGESDDIDGNYTLGRPWGNGTPVALYINTKMEVQPSAVGWNEMGTGWPKRFAEYNSMTSTGTVINLESRKTTFGENHVNNPVLTEAEAAEAGDMSNMFGDWQPTLATEQASAPTNVEYTSTTLTWDNSNYVLCWAVCKDGKVVAFTTEPTYAIDDATATWSVRAANEMGGLGEATVATLATGIDDITGADNGNVTSTAYYNLQGVRVSKDYKGVVIKVDTMLDGKQVSTKILK